MRVVTELDPLCIRDTRKQNVGHVASVGETPKQTAAAMFILSAGRVDVVEDAIACEKDFRVICELEAL